MQTEFKSENMVEILDKLHLGIMVIGPDGVVEYANLKVAQLLGVSGKHLIGSRYDEFDEFKWVTTGGKDFTNGNHPIQRALDAQWVDRNVSLNIYFPKTNLQTRIEATISPEHDDSGSIRRVVVCFEEIGSLQAVDNPAAEWDYGTILNSLPDIIVKLDSADRLQYYHDNSPGSTITFNRENLGRNIRQFLPGNLANLLTEKLTEARTTQGLVRFRHKMQQPDKKYYWFEVRIIPNANNDALLIIRDITEKADTKDALEKTVRQLETYLENTTLGYIACDAESRIVQWSRRSEEIFGYTPDEVIGQKITELGLAFSEDRSDVEQTVSELISGRVSGNVSHNRNVTKAGEVIDSIWYNSALRGANNQVISIMSLVEDVTAQKKAEVILNRNEQMLSNLISTLPGVVFRCKNDEHFTTLFMNDACYDLTGYTAEEILEDKELSFLSLALQEDYDEALPKIRNAIADNQYYEINYRIHHRNGELRYLWEKGRVIEVTETGEKILGGFVQDVTAMEKAKNELQRNNREKTVLLSEIHHRVKNNLAVISGFIQLKALENEDENIQNLLFESVGRIKSIALIHEQLYTSKDFSHIRFDKNIVSLVNDISGVMTGYRDIKIEFDLKPVVLDMNTAVPCALLINEITTNAFKHAFTGKETGTITFSCEETDNEVIISVKDDGVGIDMEKANDAQSSSIGMDIMQLITEQIEGTLDIKNENGTIITVKFDKPAK